MSGRAPPITEYRRTAHAPLTDKKRCSAGYRLLFAQLPTIHEHGGINSSLRLGNLFVPRFWPTHTTTGDEDGIRTVGREKQVFPQGRT